MKKKMDFTGITYIFLFIVLSGMFATYTTDARVYPICLLYMGIASVFFIRNKYIHVMPYPYIIASIMIVIWGYGVVMGLVMRNPLPYVVRNFAGLSLYVLIIPFSMIEIEKDKLIKIILGIADMLLCMTFFSYLSLSFLHATYIHYVPILNAFVGEGIFSGFVQYFGRELIHVTFAYHFYKLVYEKISWKSSLIVFLSVVNAVMLNDSDGDRLALVVLAVVIMISQYKRVNEKVVAIVAIGVIGAIVFSIFYGESIVLKLFSPEDIGNSRRYEQIEYFIHNISFWGQGLGAPLGDIGSGLYNYATEVIYFNIFHKFGVWASLILFCYVSTCVKAILYMVKYNAERKTQADKVIPLALMAYLIPSLANPMLFGTVSVTSHLLAMILMEKESVGLGEA